ncbi:MAG: hypothetical protein SF339_11910 [Blastocatellia bacterium]|nr:hypothetical protein [Blastocatellia bacterium]
MATYQTNLLYDTICAEPAATRPMAALRTQPESPGVCLICREEVRMIPAEKAATICQCSRRSIYRWIENGDLHFVEKADGEVLICGSSLSKKIDSLDGETGRL